MKIPAFFSGHFFGFLFLAHRTIRKALQAYFKKTHDCKADHHSLLEEDIDAFGTQRAHQRIAGSFQSSRGV